MEEHKEEMIEIIRNIEREDVIEYLHTFIINKIKGI